MSNLEAIRSAYSFDTASFILGSAIEFPSAESGGLDLGSGHPAPSAQVSIPLSMLNRHGLIAGATGTGKTVTLQVLAESIANAGVPVFAADLKGDLSGMATAGTASEKLSTRTAANGQRWEPGESAVTFYALGGRGTGIPMRATVTDFGPLLLAKVLGLNETQESVLGLIFAYADRSGLALLDLSDLRAVLQFLDSDEGKGELKAIGGVSSASVGVILRSIANLEAQGAEAFFGEPAFDISDLLRTDSGRGVISMLELPAIQDRPALFSTFLMWLLAELFENLPEVGDLDAPTLVFFFDEAHLLFKDASKAFLDSVAQTVRLIRSKGVGIFFVTQNPTDVPDEVLAQLGARVQHALRAHTPKDAKALKSTVQTFPTSEYPLEELLTSLGTGEAVVTVMDPDGSPTPVVPVRVFAPQSKMGPTDSAAIEQMVKDSPLFATYGETIDRESAREILEARLNDEAADAPQTSQPLEAPRQNSTREPDRSQPERDDRITLPQEAGGRSGQGQTGGVGEFIDGVIQSSAFKQFTRTAAREIARGIFGNRSSRRGRRR